jgi:phage terminase Nu1 subunit (DNA packaging protein)
LTPPHPHLRLVVDRDARPGRIQSAAAARILGVSQRSIQGLALRGEIPGAARIGGIWTFDADKLAAFVRQRERDAERGAPRKRVKPARQQTQTQVNAAYQTLMASRLAA